MIASTQVTNTEIFVFIAVHVFKLLSRKVLSTNREDNYRPPGWQKLLSACVSMWTESHKICKVWAIINQDLSRYFHSYGLWLNKSNHHVQQVDISESTDFNQSILMNRFYPIEALILIREFFYFHIIHHNF